MQRGLTGLCEQALGSGCPCSVFLLLLLNVLTEHVCKFNVTNSGQCAPICFRASSSSCGKDWEVLGKKTDISIRNFIKEKV